MDYIFQTELNQGRKKSKLNYYAFNASLNLGKLYLTFKMVYNINS